MVEILIADLTDLRLWLFVIIVSAVGLIEKLAFYRAGKRSAGSGLSDMPGINPERVNRLETMFQTKGTYILLLASIPGIGAATTAVNSETVEKRTAGEPSGSEQTKVTRSVVIITHMIIMPFTMIISIFLPIKLGTWWFYSGLLVYVLGLVMVLMFSISFGTAPLGQPLDKGVYAVSRHPSYMGFLLTYLGTGIACASWIFLLCSLVWIVSWHYGVIEEERMLLEKYGESYQQYMKRTPK